MEAVENNKAIFNRTGSMLVFLLGKDERGLQGVILNSYLKEPVNFHGLADMMLKLDDICDWIGCPQRAVEPRLLNERMRQRYEREKGIHPERLNKQQLNENFVEMHMNRLRPKEILHVTVEFRQYATIQGHVRGNLTDQQQVPFRSGLELMRMFERIVL